MFREMSETELIIRSIDKVRMISIYELARLNDEPGKVCAAISVFYDKEGQINLCEFDPGFELLADKVFEIYGKLEDKNSVVMDDRTRKCLELGWNREEEGFLEKYYKKDPAELPNVAFESEASRRFIAFAEYLLKGFYKAIGIKFESTGYKAGWRGAGVIYGLQSENRVVYGLKIIQNAENEYEIAINNFIETNNILTINILMENQNIILDFSTQDKAFYGTGVFDLSDKGYSETYEMYKNGKKIFYDSRFQEAKKEVVLSEEEKCLLPWDEPFQMLELPGGILYGIEKVRENRDTYLAEEFRCVYLYRAAVYSEIRSFRKVFIKESELSLKTMSVVMLIMGLTKGQYQTYFVPHLGIGKERYKDKLEGKYFLVSTKQEDTKK